MNVVNALAINIDLEAALSAALHGGQMVGKKEARRANIITIIKDQTYPTIVTTFGDDRHHHFGTLLGSVRWSVTQSKYVVSLNDAILDIDVKKSLHAKFAEGLGVDIAALAIDTAPLTMEVVPPLPEDGGKKKPLKDKN